LAAGATGYAVKKIREHDLLEAIRSASRGRMVIDLDDEERTASVFQSLRAPRSGASMAKLSERELEDLSPKTVATYRARVAEKLGLKTTADFVKYAVDTGLVAPGE
jgi:DNA-binding NarL/FixJ family response regulator